MIRKSLLVATASAIASLPFAADAAVLTSYDATATRPASDHLLSTLNPDNISQGATLGSYTWRRNQATASNNWNRSLSFQAGASGTLDELGIYVVGPGGGGGGYEFQISIREHADTPTQPTGGTSLLSTTATLNVSGADGGILKFAFSEDDVISLEKDKWYTVSLIWTSPYNSTMNFSLRDASSGLDGGGNTVTAGSWRANPAGSWVYQGSNHVLFYAATSQAIPEPSTFAMIGLVAVGAFCRCRRRNAPSPLK